MKLKKSDRTKQFIIEKAAPVFNKKGFYGTSLQDLTEATGLTKGAIYGNFTNKDAIAIAVYEHNSRQILDQIKVRVLSESGAASKLHAITEFYRQFLFNSALSGGCPILNTAVEADDTHEYLRQLVLESVDYIRRSFTYIIHQGIKAREFNQSIDSEHYATVFLAVIEGGIMQMKIYKKSRYLTDCLRHVDQLIEEMKS